MRLKEILPKAIAIFVFAFVLSVAVHGIVKEEGSHRGLPPDQEVITEFEKIKAALGNAKMPAPDVLTKLGKTSVNSRWNCGTGDPHLKNRYNENLVKNGYSLVSSEAISPGTTMNYYKGNGYVAMVEFNNQGESNRDCHIGIEIRRK